MSDENTFGSGEEPVSADVPAAEPVSAYAETPAPPAPPAPPAAPAASPFAGDKNKMVAGILAILLGALGIHKFYLGYQKEGIIMAAVSVVGSILLGLGPGIMAIIGLVEGIMYLTKSDEEFNSIYVVGRKPWF